MEDTLKQTGAIAALLDEYIRSINDLIDVINLISNEQLVRIIDENSEDEDCKSIQTILTHIIASGYIYTIEKEKHIGIVKSYPSKVFCNSTNDYILQLNQMFDYCNAFFETNPLLNISESDNSKKILVSWGQLYDIEQLMEHAIVHVLRHRRQIENFIKKQNELHTF